MDELKLRAAARYLVATDADVYAESARDAVEQAARHIEFVLVDGDGGEGRAELRGVYEALNPLRYTVNQAIAEKERQQ